MLIIFTKQKPDAQEVGSLTSLALDNRSETGSVYSARKTCIRKRLRLDAERREGPDINLPAGRPRYRD